MFVSRFSTLTFAGIALLASACADDMQIQKPIHIDSIDQSGERPDEEKELTPDVDAGVEPAADAAPAEVDAGSAESDAGSTEADGGGDHGDALPCAIEKLLKTRCQGCHSAQAKNGTPLMNFENLMAPAKVDPNQTVFERVLARMESAERPMPPMGKGMPVTTEELAQFRAWIDQGTPGDGCQQQK
jgi:mono/diheme cytochrome c family protein